MNNEYAEEVAQLKRELSEVEAELEDYRDDYAALVDGESLLAQLIVVCDNTDYLTQCLGSSVTNMSEVASSDKVPGFEELFNFDEVSSYRDSLQSKNEGYEDGLKNVCDTIDSLKGDVAEKINELSIRAEQLRSAISIYGG